MREKADIGDIMKDMMRDPLCRQYFPKGFRADLLKAAASDPTMKTLDTGMLEFIEPGELWRIMATEAGWAGETSGRGTPLLPCAAPGSAAYGEDEIVFGGEGNSGVRILVDHMGTQAKLILHDTGEAPLNPREIRLELIRNGIVRGVKSEFIERLTKRPVYNRRFLIAEGEPPQKGSDGRVKFYFQAEKDLAPPVNNKGTADYKSLAYLQFVKKGSLLCELFPPGQGKDGYDVFGSRIPSEDGNSADIGCGDNTQMSDDGRRIYASCEGQVSFRGNKLYVFPVLTMNRVDVSTGNVGYKGTVIVGGDVGGGSTILAEGDVIIKGNVESARIIAGGNILLLNGMKGMRTGTLGAGGSIRSAFVENTAVSARECLFADFVINCTVKCGYMVKLSGKNGSIQGGECTAGAVVDALQIGNGSYVSTHVEIRNTEPSSLKKEEIRQKARKKLDTARRLKEGAEKGKHEPAYGYQLAFARILYLRWRLREEAFELEREAGRDKVLDSTKEIRIRGKCYANTLMEIGGKELLNEFTQSHKAVVLVDGQMKIKELEF